MNIDWATIDALAVLATIGVVAFVLIWRERMAARDWERHE